MKTKLNDFFTIGVDKETSDLIQSSRKFFIYDCLIFLISTFTTGVIQIKLRDSMLFGLIMISFSLLAILALYLQSKNQYFKAITLIQISSLLVVLLIGTLSNSPFFPIFLLPIGLSFFIYFEEYKNPFKYFTIYLISGISFALLFFNLLEQPNVFDNPINKSIRIIIFGILFLYKLFAITYIFKKTIQINSDNELNIKLSEHRYKNQFENNLLGMVVFGKRMNVEDANPAFCKMIGYSKKELIENRILEKSLQQDPALQKKIEQLSKREINSFTIQKIFQRKDGYPLYTTSFISATYNQDGNIINSNCSFLDITENVEVEQQMNLKNQIVEGLIENFPAFYYCFDENLIFTECVGSGLKKLGFKRNDIVGIKLSHLCKDYPDIIKHHYNALKGDVVTFESVINLRKNRKEYLEIKVFYDPISKVGTAVGFVVTEKKKAEIKIEQSEEQFRTLFEYAFDGIMIYDINKKEVVGSNQKIKPYFDVLDGNIDLKDFERFIPESPINGQPPFNFLSQKIQEVLTLNKSQFEITHYNLSGEISHSEVSSVRLPASQNHLIVIIFKDISEKKNSEVIIQKTFSELKQKNIDLEKYIESNNQLENFAYMASHDLKSPLRTITSYSQLLARRAKDKLDDTELEFFDFIINASKSMSNLIENLLNYSKANSQNKVLEELNMVNLLGIIQHDLKADIDEKNVKMILPKNPILINADRTRIRQVFQNLISNAIKFIDADKTPRIEINHQELEGHFQFSIKDNGIGIKPEYHEKIFNLFQKLHGAGDFEGTGIGLALCKKIIEQHGGKIWVESIYGEGTTFFFTIQKNKEKISVKNKSLKVAY